MVKLVPMVPTTPRSVGVFARTTAFTEHFRPERGLGNTATAKRNRCSGTNTSGLCERPRTDVLEDRKWLFSKISSGDSDVSVQDHFGGQIVIEGIDQASN